MPRQTTYLQRRGDVLFFRLSVPADLRPFVGGREITKTLRTTNKRVAVPLALEYAACVIRMFSDLRAGMVASDENKLLEIARKAKEKLRLDAVIEEHEGELDDLRARHKLELKQVKLETENEVLKRVLAGSSAMSALAPAQLQADAPVARKTLPAPMFKTVVDGFLDSYQRDKKQAMFKKHQPVLKMLLDVVGNKPVTELMQADINGFFALLEKLPPLWNNECRKRKITIRQLAEIDHPVTLGPKTFDDTYKASVRAFLKVAKKDWQDQGFPTNLTTEGAAYRGDREEGEDKQRAFKPAELKRLFEGPEMKAFAENPAQSHCYWLPHIGLFTGARVNEICQINPQTDILQDSESDIWYLWITEETEGDERIDKSTKNKESRRKVPIHSNLLELGLLAYVENVKKQGAKLLFPAWKPGRGRASFEAEKWFRQLLLNTGLRDETPGGRLVGMHAFRHTLLNRASNTNPPIDATSITGHAGEKSAIVRGYEGQLSVENKRRILEAIRFELSFFKPQLFHS